MCPSRGEIGRGDVANLDEELVPQQRRLSGIKEDAALAFRAAAPASVTRPLWLVWRATIGRLQRAYGRCRGRRVGSRAQMRRIKIILTCDADEREQGVATRVGQRCAHALGARHLGNGTDRPI